MKLAPHEIASPAWQRIVEHYAPIIATHRARLENPRIQEAERIELCWRIHEIKNLLALAEPDKKESDAG